MGFGFGVSLFTVRSTARERVALGKAFAVSYPFLPT